MKTKTKCTIQLELSQEEAINLVMELGQIDQDTKKNPTINLKLFMVLSDTLQDLKLIEKTKNRNGHKSNPRLENDNVIIKMQNDVNQKETAGVKG